MIRISSVLSGWAATLFLVSGCYPASSSSLDQIELSASRDSTTGTTTATIANLVRAEYDGERALETVAVLDEYVRWTGNRGYDASIDHIVERLVDAGFVLEDGAPEDSRLTFRIEEYPMTQPAWEPLDASVMIVGQDQPILEFTFNRNMLANGSYSTPEDGVVAELVDVGSGSVAELDAVDIRGKIVLADGRLSSIFRRAVSARGASGVFAYSLSHYLLPETNKYSIQFTSISRDDEARSWGIALSTDAREKLHAALAEGTARVRVKSKVEWTEKATERTVVADVHGDTHAEQRFVFSAHVQEPGANDNASGVGAQLEMARVAAALVNKGEIKAHRSITFLWGHEIRSTGRYVSQNASRAEGILWGLSLDMVGEDTQKTGGTFLIEKMPDPSAIWTRGEEKHTDWGGRPIFKGDMTPHYFNDFVLARALEQAATNGWIVKTNPYEGGSDHVPFLRAGIPGILLWHFTDQFYHTDRDRLEMVSAEELKNVGVTALVSALALVSADGEMAMALVEEVREAALSRLSVEAALSVASLAEGGKMEEEREILQTWASWYVDALSTMEDIEVGGSTAPTRAAIDQAKKDVASVLNEALDQFELD